MTSRKLLTETCWVLGITFCRWLFEFTTLSHWLESQALDVIAQIVPRKESNEVVVVQITGDDFRDLFHGKRPLNPELIRRAVKAIATGHAKVIGIDLDFDARTFEEQVSIFWARDIENYSASLSRKDKETFEDKGKGKVEDKERDEKVRPLWVLGREDATQQPKSGLVVFPVDPDGVVRHYGCIDASQARLDNGELFSQTCRFGGYLRSLFLKFSGDGSNP